MSWNVGGTGGSGGGGVIVPSSARAYVEGAETCGKLQSRQQVVQEKISRIAFVIQSTQPNTAQSLGSKHSVTVA